MAFCSTLCLDTPSQRVQFILGTEDDDLEHVPHDLFTEMDELSFRDGTATEWRETARLGGRWKCEQHNDHMKFKKDRTEAHSTDLMAF